MKKEYMQPQERLINLDTENAFMTGSKITISNKPVDHFDSNKMRNDETSIWSDDNTLWE